MCPYIHHTKHILKSAPLSLLLFLATDVHENSASASCRIAGLATHVSATTAAQQYAGTEDAPSTHITCRTATKTANNHDYLVCEDTPGECDTILNPAPTAPFQHWCYYHLAATMTPDELRRTIKSKGRATTGSYRCEIKPNPNDGNKRYYFCESRLGECHAARSENRPSP